ncbi:peptide ABC transporter substrate-binding protein [Hydrogenophaga crassostreae]|uniref:ABC transporter substrate-binding protein n=1 Tax=Hydrogenophaga crassostreae TaxID=1763535 RepID=A0A167IW82_9BURK|nr:ABC transporter substrate-binding protein [Hydrogenophaga crassostreae]AOW14287.1 ABC transporter substrate-binding protein [Hydrogenophaga crassostreae]OAD43690.1 peptide ABC transporter substrate-binding protein [Hydrogenophaga crassostreae]
MFKLNKVILALGLSAAAMVSHAAGTLVYCSEGSPEGFDNAQYTSGTTFDASGHAMFNRLVGFKKGTTEIEPSLATAWNVSADGMTYTFTLRKGVKFHSNDSFKPGRDFNADDVIFTFSRMINKDLPFNKGYPAEFPYASDTGIADNIESITKTDPLTVVFKLKKPDADMLAKVAMPFASILSGEFAAKLLAEGKASEINQQPIGTGPFQLRRYQKDSQIRYVKHKDYWDAKNVLVDNLVFAITTDASVRYQKMKADECQIMSYPKPQDIAAMRAESNLKVESAPGFNIGYLSYNMEKPLTSKPEVRQALDMAINRKAILEAVYQGQGQEASNPFPASLWSYNTALKNAPFNPEKAKELLKKAGVAEGTELTIWAMPVQRPYNPNAKLMAEMIQADWAKIGIKAKFTTYEWGEYLKRMKAGEHDTGLIGWTGDYASPDNFLGVLLTCEAVGGSNYARYCSKDFDALVLKARSSTDQNERVELYKKAQEIFKKDMPWSTIAHSTVNQPMSKRLNGFKISPFGDYNFEGVSVK